MRARARASLGNLLRWVGTAATLGLMIYLLAQQDWDDILAALRRFTLWRLATAIGLMVISRLAVAFRWHILLASGGAQIKAQQSLQLTFAGLFASNFLPSTIGGDVVRLAGTVRLGIDSALSLASLLTDRLVGILSMSVTFPLGLYAVGWLPGRASPAQAGILTEMVLPAWMGEIGLRARHGCKRLWRALQRWLNHPKMLAASFFLSFIHMACLFSVLWVLLDGLGEPLPLWLAAGLWSFIYLVTLLPISINGFGLQEVSVAFLFSSIGGVSQQSGLLLALLVRTLLMLTSLPGALYLPSILAETQKHPELLASGQDGLG